MTLDLRHALGALSTALMLCWPTTTAAQSADMSFFVAVEGASWGADQPALEVSDTQCTDLAYAQGFGHLTWHAYLNGSAADGEGDEVARERIGSGPWHNFYGVVIAENLAQLHSDDNNLWGETAVTQLGEYPPEGALEIPWGSALNGDLYDRDGPYFCFGF